jgi:hypothetical protein
MRSTRGLTRLWPRLARKYENSWCVRVKQRRQPDEARKENGSLQGATRFLDASVWLRLHQDEEDGPVPNGPCQPLWLTLRRPLTYHAAHRMSSGQRPVPVPEAMCSSESGPAKLQQGE